MKQILLSAGVILVMCLTVSAQQSEIFVKDNAAIGGYDVVAYFKEGKPVKGSTDFRVTYKGATWLFTNKDNADLFKVTPEKYEPQYGGYCAFGCSRGYKAKTNPDAWTIVNGKLYLNYNTDVRATWNKDQRGYIEKADANWLQVKNTKYP
ncbi:MAG TPA: YHS domain-containing (seleno)protein [Chitinophagaceae bacterium]|nr:YHS domain-containing (seleno)protein [Chitinophagaceae bacterium]